VPEAAARVTRVGRRSVEHRDQGSRRITDRRAEARQADVTAAKVLLTMDDDRSALGDAGAHAVRAFPLLAPVRTGHQPGRAKGIRERRVGLLVEDDASSIREDEGVTGLGNIFVQPVDFGRSNLQQLGVLIAPLPERRRVDDRG
jgi:hypothetical protein